MKQTVRRYQNVSNEIGKEQKKKGGRIVLIICIVVIIALCILIYFLLHKDDPPKRDVVVNEDNVEEIISQMEGVDPGHYQMTMNSVWNFESGDASSDNAYVENSEENHNPVYFDITRSDTEETILESPIIPVGSHMDKIKLDKKLKAGTYDCVMTYHLLDEKDETISTVRVSLTIVVKH